MPNPLSYTDWHYQNPTAGAGSRYVSGNPYQQYQQYLGNFGTPAPGPSPGFSPNPSPQAGVSSPFGSVPGPVGLPNRFGDLSTVFPNLSATNQQVSGVLNQQLAGQVPNADVAFLQDRGAEAAQRGGMPGSNVLGESLFGHRSARDYGLLEMQRQQQGIGNYGNIVGAISGTQTVSPETQIGLADRNATYASAPNPAAAQTYAQNLYNRYLNDLQSGGQYRSPGGGTGNYSMPTFQSPGQPTVPGDYSQGAGTGGGSYFAPPPNYNGGFDDYSDVLGVFDDQPQADDAGYAYPGGPLPPTAVNPMTNPFSTDYDPFAFDLGSYY